MRFKENSILDQIINKIRNSNVDLRALALEVGCSEKKLTKCIDLGAVPVSKSHRKNLIKCYKKFISQ